MGNSNLFSHPFLIYCVEFVCHLVLVRFLLLLLLLHSNDDFLIWYLIYFAIGRVSNKQSGLADTPDVQSGVVGDSAGKRIEPASRILESQPGFGLSTTGHGKQADIF